MQQRNLDHRSINSFIIQTKFLIHYISNIQVPDFNYKKLKTNKILIYYLLMTAIIYSFELEFHVTHTVYTIILNNSKSISSFEHSLVIQVQYIFYGIMVK